MAMSTSQPALFTSLRLSKSDFAAYSERYTDGTWKRPMSVKSKPIKVIGARDDVTEAIKMSNPKKKDYLEVKWSDADSMLWITQRLEQQLKVPLRHWCLAGDGIVFDPGHLVGNVEMFQNASVQPVLTLLPISDVDEYLASNAKTYTWKRLEPEAAASDDPRELAKAKFHLIQPIPSKHWAAYIGDRSKAEEEMDEHYEDYTDDEPNYMLSQITKYVEMCLVEAIGSGDQCDAIADGVLIIDLDATDDGGSELRDCEIVSRIYSPTTPASVDVSFFYYHRTRWESVEWLYMICYRINPIPSAEGTKMGKIPRDLHRIPRGWRLLSGGGMDDDASRSGRRWRPVEFKEFNLSSHGVDELHRHLFGPPTEGNLASRFSKVHMIKLMLASVGISYKIDTAQQEGQRITDGQQTGRYRFELCMKKEWLAVKVRQACRAPLERDASFKDYNVVEAYGDEDEDEDEDDEDDEDEDGDDDEDDALVW